MLDYVVIYLSALMSTAMLHVMNEIYNGGYNC
jgi:hypothetical protein